MAGKKSKKGCQTLTNAEAEIMHGVWALYPRKGNIGPQGITVREVHNHLYPENQKAVSTVQTVMDHLEKKGLLKTERINRRFKFFTPYREKSFYIESFAGVRSTFTRVLYPL